MSEPTVRVARPSDLPAALALWRALHREHEAQDDRYRQSDDAASIERSAGGWTWEPEADARLAVGEAELHIAVPRKLFGNGSVNFNFKWADNMPENGEIITWLTGGDAAPNSRFSYPFEESAKPSVAK